MPWDNLLEFLLDIIETTEGALSERCLLFILVLDKIISPNLKQTEMLIFGLYNLISKVMEILNQNSYMCYTPFSL